MSKPKSDSSVFGWILPAQSAYALPTGQCIDCGKRFSVGGLIDHIVLTAIKGKQH